MILLLLGAVIVTFFLYKRYFPVLGVSCTSLYDLESENIIIIDVRDFNESYKDPIKGAINFPIAYLKRNVKEIPKSDLHLVVSSPIEKNIGIRFLRKKGYRVISFTCKNDKHLLYKENNLKIETNC